MYIPEIGLYVVVDDSLEMYRSTGFVFLVLDVIDSMGDELSVSLQGQRKISSLVGNRIQRFGNIREWRRHAGSWHSLYVLALG